MPYSYNPMLGVSDFRGVNYITADRIPTASDYDGIEVPTIWINLTTDTPYILVDKTGGTSTWQAIVATSFSYYSAVLSVADCTAAPPTTNIGDRYIIDNTVGAINAGWGVGAAKNDIAEYAGAGVWSYTTPVEGGLVYVKDVTGLYFFDGTDWQNIGLAVPVMTDTTVGTGELATDAETIAGTLSDYHVVNPSALKAKLGAQTAHGVLVGAGQTAAITALAVGTNGQVLVGSTGADPVFATISSANGSITTSTGAGTLGLTVTQATDSQLGGAEFATDAETTTGTSTSLMVNPATLNTKLGAQTAYCLLLGGGGAGFNLSSLAIGSAGQILTSQGAGANPAWTTSTYPATTAVGDILYGSALNTVTGLAFDNTATRYLKNTGTGATLPEWGQVDLTNGVTGALPVGNGGTGATTFALYNLLYGNTTNALQEITNGTDGQVLLAATGAAPLWATLASASGLVTFTPAANALDFSVRAASSAQTGVVEIATNAETKTGTSTSLVLTPDDLSNYQADKKYTGFFEWGGAGNYYSVTGTNFSVLRDCTVYILGKKVSFTATQTISSLSAGNTHYIYVDSTGTLQSTTTRTDALYEENAVLFEVLVDSDSPENLFVVKENHPSKFPVAASNEAHAAYNVVISDASGGAVIAKNGTKGIQIDGADVLLDHGLATTVPDSSSAAVTFNYMYTDGSGDWILQVAQNTVPSIYNNAGTPTSLGANKFGVFRYYVAKDDLNSSAAQYFAVVGTAQYDTAAAAYSAINSGMAEATNELAGLELCQLGYVIFDQASDAIDTVIVAKESLQKIASAGSSSQEASSINTDTTNFDAWLSAADSTVQAALETLDDIGKNMTVDDVNINGSVISSVANHLEITPVAGKYIIMDGAWAFDGTSMFSYLDQDVYINNAYATRSIAVDGVTFKNGAVSDVTTISMSGQLTSTLAIGTAPFVITSTTVVSNLNVDQVDGYDFDQALLQASSPTFAGATLSGLNVAGGIVQTDGSGVLSSSTDLPTATTIGTKYIYRADGTDVPLADGGSNASLVADKGGVVYSTDTALAILAHTVTANQVLLSANADAPAWSTATYPATTTANQILYSSAANTIGEITTGNSGVLVTSGAGVPSIATDIPTAVTIGTKYIYRADGTDVPIADGGTNSSAALANGKMMVSSGGAIVEGTPTVVGADVGAITNLTATTIYGTTFDTNVAAAALQISAAQIIAAGSDAAIDITITPKGTGSVVMSKVDVNGGTIDACTLGTNSVITDARIDNIKIDGNTISSTSGVLNLTPVAGSAAVIDGHWSFDGNVMTGVTDNNTIITAYAGKNITIESVTIDAGVMAGLSSVSFGANDITILTTSYSTAYKIGVDNTAGGVSCAIGRSNSASGVGSVAIGYSNTATASTGGAVALGYDHSVTSDHSLGAGYKAAVSGAYSFGFGDRPVISGSEGIALGNQPSVTHNNCFVFADATARASSANNEVTFGAAGGFRILGTAPLYVEGDVRPVTDDTYYLGKNDDDTPAAWKGLILKDTTDGKYYRLQITNGAVEVIDLTD